MKKFSKEIVEAAITQFVGLSVIQFEMVKSGVSVFDPVYRSAERKTNRIQKTILSSDANAWDTAQDMFVAYLLEQ